MRMAAVQVLVSHAHNESSGVCLSTLIMGSWLQEELWSARKLIVAVRRPRQPAGENFWAREGRVLDGKWCSCDGRGRLRAAWAMATHPDASDECRTVRDRERSANRLSDL